MNLQLTQLVRYTPISEFQLCVERVVNAEDVHYEPPDLDFYFMNQLLTCYESLSDPNLNALIRVERHLFTTEDFDKERFFERQYLLLQKQLQMEPQLYEILFQFKAKLNGRPSALFKLKSFEAFEQILLFQLENAPEITRSNRLTFIARKSTKAKSDKTPRKRQATMLSPKKKGVMNAEQIEQSQSLYDVQNMNGLEFYDLNQLEAFNQKEQQIILDISEHPKQLINQRVDSQKEMEKQQIRQEDVLDDDIEEDPQIKRLMYLKYIYGNTELFEEIIEKTQSKSVLKKQALENVSTNSEAILSLYYQLKHETRPNLRWEQLRFYCQRQFKPRPNDLQMRKQRMRQKQLINIYNS